MAEPYTYPDLLKQLPPGAKQDLEEFHKKPLKERWDAGPGWAQVTGGGTPAGKMEGDWPGVELVKFPNGPKKCGNCRYLYFSYDSKKDICSWVRPYVEKKWYCRKWKPQLSAK